MHVLTATVYLTGKVTWRASPRRERDSKPGLRLNILLTGERTEGQALSGVTRVVEREGIDWLLQRGTIWLLDAAQFRHWLTTERIAGFSDKFLVDLSRLDGTLVLTPELEYKTRRNGRKETIVQFDLFTTDESHSSHVK